MHIDIIVKKQDIFISINNFDNTIINLRFVDSYKHLTSPLNSIVKSLLNKDTDINSIKTKFPSLFQNFGGKALKLLRKGVYPYDYMHEDWENELEEKEYLILNIFRAVYVIQNVLLIIIIMQKKFINYLVAKK